MKWLRAVLADGTASMWVPMPNRVIPAWSNDLVAVAPTDCTWQVVENTDSPALAQQPEG